MKIKALSSIAVAGILAAGAGYLWYGKSDQPRILFIDSYHEGYAWSDGITAGINRVFADNKVTLKVHRMDTKRNRTDEFKKKAALRAKAVIEEFKPDVVIATDDNAAKYLIVPYYRGGPLPFVFAGINWDASHYGFPASNVTGMVEVNASAALLDVLRTFSGGVTVGFLSDDTASTQKELKNSADVLDLQFDKVALVNTFEEWKQAYLEMQEQVDVLYFYNNAGIKGWDDVEAARFALEHAKIPSGAVQAWIAPYVLMVFPKDATEQGEWAALTALQIANGVSPSEIPIVQNKRSSPLINSILAKKLQLDIPPELIAGTSTAVPQQ
jgi:ABC-type uncharacterized transport system substrate-binding protein